MCWSQVGRDAEKVLGAFQRAECGTFFEIAGACEEADKLFLLLSVRCPCKYCEGFGV